MGESVPSFLDPFELLELVGLDLEDFGFFFILPEEEEPVDGVEDGFGVLESKLFFAFPICW